MHYSVMKDIAIDALNVKSDGIYVDATLGYSGHASEILKRMEKGKLFAFDMDDEAIHHSYQKLIQINDHFEIIHSNFMYMKEELEKRNIEGVDGYLFDLGLSSPEIDDASRGFSFMHDAELDMRMDKNARVTAKDIVNTYEASDLANIFFKYGEEPRSKSIASKIVEYRKTKEIKSTLELVEIIKSGVGANYFFKNHPEREIFQALRIEVNHELEAIEKALPEAIKNLKKGGRIVVITFHSLEDRIVKNIFKKLSSDDELSKKLPIVPESMKARAKLITKKGIKPTEEEIETNKRSRSATLRIIEKI